MINIVTIEGIHTLREYNYYRTKDMTLQERIDYYNKRGLEIHRKIQEHKSQKHYECRIYYDLKAS